MGGSVSAAVNRAKRTGLLDLSESRLKTLPEEMFKLANLEVLYLTHNNLSTLPDRFGSLTTLKVLYLHNNQLDRFPHALCGVSSLTWLNLNFNSIAEIPAEIGKLQALKEFYMRGNKLTQLPREIGLCQGLTLLYLYENQLRSVPDTIGRLSSLTEISLSHNQLQSLPIELGNCQSLTKCDISFNALTALPPALGRLSRLRELFVDNNQLDALHDDLCRLPALEYLSLANNIITALPPSIGQLTSLTVLNVSGNTLMEVPIELASLTALTALDLSRTRVTTLPAELGALRSLTKLALEACPLRPPLSVVAHQGVETVLALLRDLKIERTEIQILSRQLSALRQQLEQERAWRATVQQRLLALSPEHITPVIDLTAPPPPPPLSPAGDGAEPAPSSAPVPLSLRSAGLARSDPTRAASEPPTLGGRLSVLSGDGEASAGRSGLPSGAGAAADSSSAAAAAGEVSIDPSVLRIEAQDVEIQRPIGEGYFSEVWLGRWNGLDVAVKRIKASDERKRRQIFQREVAVWCKLRHPNIVLLIGVIVDKEQLSIVLEYLPGGTLFQSLRSKGRPALPQAVRCARQVASAVSALHRLQPTGIIHRDLSSVNVLLDEHWNAKLSDFGESRFLDGQTPMTAAKGNFLWMAPEVFRGESYTVKADVFSFGLILWELLTGEELFPGHQPLNAAAAMAYEGLRPDIPGHISPPLRGLLQRLWHADPSQRPELSETLQILDSVLSERRGQPHQYVGLSM